MCVRSAVAASATCQPCDLARSKFYFGGCLGDRIGCSDPWPLSGRGHGRSTSDILLGSRARFGPRAEVEGAVASPAKKRPFFLTFCAEPLPRAMVQSAISVLPTLITLFIMRVAQIFFTATPKVGRHVVQPRQRSVPARDAPIPTARDARSTCVHVILSLFTLAYSPSGPPPPLRG